MTRRKVNILNGARTMNGKQERARRVRQIRRYQLRGENGLLVPGWRYLGHGCYELHFGDPLEKHDTTFVLNPIPKPRKP